MTKNFAKLYSRECFNALSIPIDALTMDSACDRILEMIGEHARNPYPRYVATVNVDFLVNSLGVGGRQAKHPELLDSLRGSDLVTADGFPIVLLSKLMGTELPERVTGADLVPALAKAGAGEGLRLYFLGGQPETAQAAADILKNTYPGVQIAGVDSPMVHTQGDALIDYASDDERVVKLINESCADVLLLGLGNPKQEQWFRRNREKLQVPVTIGVGGTFDFIAGTVKRAPKAIQALNLEWVYRITQDPGRLWKRYVIGLVKLACLCTPALVARATDIAQKRISKLTNQPSDTLKKGQMSGPNQSNIATFQLPSIVTEPALKELLNDLLEARFQNRLNLVDFSRAKRIEVTAMQAMYNLGQYIAQGDRQVLLMGLGSGVRRRIRQWHMMDLFDRGYLEASDIHTPLESFFKKISDPMRLYTSESSMVLYLHGNLDADTLEQCGLAKVLGERKEGKSCVIDLRYTQLVDSSAVVFFHKLAAQSNRNDIYFSGIKEGVRRMFDLQKLTSSLQFISDREQHRLMISA